MSYDGLFTHAIVNDLKEQLLTGRVSKIYQPFPNELTLRIRANRKNHQLFLSAHPQYARVQLTDLKFENPQEPPQYCMVLRKYIEGAILTDIHQIGNDRIIEFVFTGRDELGDEQNYHLIAEIMGRHSNILLVNKDENTIYEAIRHVPAALNSYRTLLPGADYRPAPPQDNVNPFDYSGEVKITGEKMKEKIHSVQSQFQGFGRDSARELLFQFDEHPEKSSFEVLQNFLEPYAKNELNPTLTVNKGRSSFTPYDYESIPGEKEYFDSLTELLDEFYENKAERDRVHQQSNDLAQLLKSELKKNKNKLKKLKREKKQAQKAKQYQVKGEVLTAFMHQVEQGMEEIELENFYDDNKKIKIELDPEKSPAANAQWYFKNYQRLNSRKKHLAKQIPLTRQEIEYIDSLLAQVDIASSGDLEDIREELRDQGYLRKQKNHKKKKRKKSKPEKYYSTAGDLILVGKNNKQNDRLTMRTANKSDYWLHTKDIPGSHVIIRNDDPSEETLEEAALLAAYFSKYRMSSSVPVDYTQVKYVNKPNGAKPGYVIYDNQQTLFVTPSLKDVKKLKTKS